ncbi:MAG: tyrosine-type recombinase/integrase [Pseudomonadales bacterium]
MLSDTCSPWPLVTPFAANKQRKGCAKLRRVPLTEVAVQWLREYVNNERPKAKGAKDYQHVFLTCQGVPYQAKGISFLVSRYLKQSGLRARGGSHILRHSVATHMLQNGADIRAIQLMLGHSELSSMQIYTRVQDPVLKRVHAETHPARVAAEKDKSDSS